MSEIHVLIVEDKPEWQQLLERNFVRLGRHVRVHIASTQKIAEEIIRTQYFHLATIDLNLPDKEPDVNVHGFRVIEFMNSLKARPACAFLILTNQVTPDYMHRAFLDLGVEDFMDKDTFNLDKFMVTACKALYRTQMRRLEAVRARRNRLTFSFRQDALVSVQLRGPDRYRETYLSENNSIHPRDVVDRTERQSRSLKPPLRGAAQRDWYAEASSIGKATYQLLSANQAFATAIALGKELATDEHDLALHFNSPDSLLSVPFELLNDGQEELALRHPLHRQLYRENEAWSRKIDPFHLLLDHLRDTGDPLRILLIASNIDGHIPAVDEEIGEIETLLVERTRTLGFTPNPEIEVCPSREATFDRVKALLDLKQFHIVHYAGHGRSSDSNKGQSGIYLRNGNDSSLIPLAVLQDLFRNSQTHFVFLNCCLGARMADQPEPGNLSGIVDSVIRADVPSVLGYRWVVTDEAAKFFACAFYDALFDTLSIEDSVLRARNEADQKFGRDNETWASPVLVLQNP